jgi:hypothetical protein
MYEPDAMGLMEEMAKKNIAVEICLTSNDTILGVTGSHHPLATYIKYGVPVALATDDLGVSRSDMTHEYLKAAQEQGLSYTDLKRLARASLEHSFLAGTSLWKDGSAVDACPIDKAASEACSRLLKANERARVQWELEKAFVEFEKKF